MLVCGKLYDSMMLSCDLGLKKCGKTKLLLNLLYTEIVQIIQKPITNSIFNKPEDDTTIQATKNTVSVSYLGLAQMTRQKQGECRDPQREK